MQNITQLKIKKKIYKIKFNDLIWISREYTEARVSL